MCEKKGACLARRIETGLFYDRWHHLGALFRSGSHEGELRSGLSGWMHETAEVLELLTFWKRGTAGGSPFSNLASSSPKDLWEDSEKIRAFLKELLYNEKL